MAERKIGCVTNLARTMLFHPMISWSSHVITSLWPFEIKYAIDLHNATTGHINLSTLEIFSGLKYAFDFTKFHTFGSLTYVLEPALQNGNKTPRLNARCKVRFYLGKSAEHAGTLHLMHSTSFYPALFFLLFARFAFNDFPLFICVCHFIFFRLLFFDARCRQC